MVFLLQDLPGWFVLMILMLLLGLSRTIMAKIFAFSIAASVPLSSVLSDATLDPRTVVWFNFRIISICGLVACILAWFVGRSVRVRYAPTLLGSAPDLRRRVLAVVGIILFVVVSSYGWLSLRYWMAPDV